ncbi:nucleotidyl transferase AbiEii/AbiGii toxin family protein [Actinomadura verrucosospora]|uniref:Ankyrin n=1 Tax=Actinomadura verrucosospora TaxID=46165 RepID=A0A7D3VXA0_ACTVE|nr:nucleotidyl transferase AbiEii/AbiGii toxin family protein [Actinomadura verrucosospora]QKG21336.1 ankyrin [Actinomadura verrucosospora]
MTEDPPLLGMAPYEPTLQEIAHEGALDHVLEAISLSKWGSQLVLRGSALMRAWYGHDARTPHDLDFVVDSGTWKNDERQTEDIFEDLFLDIEYSTRTDLMDGLRFVPSRIRRSSISAYGGRETMVRDREDDRWGFRLTLPWHCGDASGEVQVDFAFDEKLHVPPCRTAIPRPSGDAPLLLRAATPEQSLCWKLCWLLLDSSPQCKDLYDVWLLRNVRPSAQLLDKTCDMEDTGIFVGASWLYADRARWDAFDWDGFRAAHPAVRGAAADYAKAIADDLVRPLFDPEAPAPPASAG